MKTQIKLKHKLIISGIFVLGVLTLYAGQKVLSHQPAFDQQRAKVLVKELQVHATNEQAKAKANKIKIALLLDTSNSMDGLIDQAKSQLWTIVNELAQAKCDSLKPEIEIALYEYGNDRLSASNGHIRLVTSLTNDLDKISEDLFRLSTNGGEEYCGQVIQTAANQLEWSANETDLQVIFIAGNEEFSQGRFSYKEACAQAKKKNIIVNTIFCGDFTEGISTGWKNGADLAGGNYMSIEQNSKTVYIPSPYDNQITKLNSKLNSTYIEYGREGKMKKELQLSQDSNAGSYSKSNEVNRAVSKTTHIYKNKSWDMVDATEDKEFDVTKVSKEQLPDTMKTMNNDQKLKYVEAKKCEREKIKAEILELNKKREIYIAQQKKVSGEDDKMLDRSMMNAIKKQAAQKNLRF